MESDEDHNWDGDFDLDSKLQQPASPLSPTEQDDVFDEDEEWTETELQVTIADTQTPDPVARIGRSATATQRLTIVGLQADSFETEDWDSDFESSPAKPVVAAALTQVDTIPEEEDWDKEFMGSDGTAGNLKVTKALQRMVLDNGSDADASMLDFQSWTNMPAEHQFRRLLQTSEIRRLPKPTQLYSMRTKDGLKHIPELELDIWIRNLVLKHDKANGKYLDETAKMAVSLSNAPPLSPEWSEAFLYHYIDFYRRNARVECEDLLGSLFDDIETHVSSAEKAESN